MKAHEETEEDGLASEEVIVQRVHSRGPDFDNYPVARRHGPLRLLDAQGFRWAILLLNHGLHRLTSAGNRRDLHQEETEEGEHFPPSMPLHTTQAGSHSPTRLRGGFPAQREEHGLCPLVP